jgi:pimeloyl-ACP methyl ester carboxylesterase
MGLGSQLILWPDDFVEDLGRRGYRIIRFDNRDCGKSDPVTRQYLLRAMAADVEKLMDYLAIEDAHIVGASMGGMIAQLVAINHRTYVRSLCSIMSAPGPDIKSEPGVIDELLKTLPADKEEAIEHIAKQYDLIGSKSLKDEEHDSRRQFARESYDRGINTAGTVRQAKAILMTQDRTENLKTLEVPTLVVHGAEDSLINISCGQATADAVPNSTWLELEQMGHDLPRSLRPEIAEAIDVNAKRAR